jgi:tripartite-type tricarboxylate transporter receptor subunit TctC
MTFLRRHFFRLLGATLITVGASQIAPVRAESVQPLRLIVPCAAGTPADLLARIVAKGMSENAGYEVQVENITAGSGPIDLDTIDKLLTDGQTIIFNLANCDDEDKGPQTTISKK